MTPNTELQKAIESVERAKQQLGDGISCYPPEVLEALLSAAKQLQQVQGVRLKEILHTCVHHTDAERKDARCPICLNATHGTLLVALDYNRTERDELNTKLQQIEKERDELRFLLENANEANSILRRNHDQLRADFEKAMEALRGIATEYPCDDAENLNVLARKKCKQAANALKSLSSPSAMEYLNRKTQQAATEKTEGAAPT